MLCQNSIGAICMEAFRRDVGLFLPSGATGAELRCEVRANFARTSTAFRRRIQ